jgi:hypothetical protein
MKPGTDRPLRATHHSSHLPLRTTTPKQFRRTTLHNRQPPNRWRPSRSLAIRIHLWSRYRRRRSRQQSSAATTTSPAPAAPNAASYPPLTVAHTITTPPPHPKNLPAHTRFPPPTSSGLENRYPCKRIGGSNPLPSAFVGRNPLAMRGFGSLSERHGSSEQPPGRGLKGLTRERTGAHLARTVRECGIFGRRLRSARPPSSIGENHWFQPFDVGSHRTPHLFNLD